MEQDRLSPTDALRLRLANSEMQNAQLRAELARRDAEMAQQNLMLVEQEITQNYKLVPNVDKIDLNQNGVILRGQRPNGQEASAPVS